MLQMSEKLDKLKNLQEVLAEKYEIEAKVEELPKTLDGSTESLDRFKKEYIQRNAEYEEKKALVAQLKEELAEAQKRREEGEKGMDAITTHREYEILEKQISEAQSIEDAKRKELQKEEKALEEINEILKGSEALISSTENDVNETREGLEKEVAEFKAKLEELSKQEEEIADGIETETVMKFQRIIRRNRNGIVAVTGNVCSGCHMVLPAQFANEVRHGEKIFFCPYCSRILFYEESMNTEQYYSTMESLDSDNADEDLLDDEDLLEVDEEAEEADSSYEN